MAKIQLLRGLKENLPQTLLAGQPAVALNTRELFVGNAEGQVVKISDVVFGAPTVADQGKLFVDEASNTIKKFNAVSGQWEEITGFITNDTADSSVGKVFSTQAIKDILAGYYTQVEIDEFLNAIDAKNGEQDGRLSAIETKNAGQDQALADEVSRAQGAEQALDAKIAQEVADRQAAVTGVQGAVDAEVARAKAAEQANAQAVADEKVRAQAKEAELVQAIADEKARAEAVEETKVDKAEVGVTIAELDSQGYVPLSQINPVYRELKVVADIDARDAIEPKFEGLMTFVQDASDDAEVASGNAMYIYTGTEFVKVSEGNELDAVTEWVDIQGKPAHVVALGQTADGSHLTFGGKVVAFSEELSAVEAQLRQELADEKARAEAAELAVNNRVQAVEEDLAAKAGKVGPTLLAVDEAGLSHGAFLRYDANLNKLVYSDSVDFGTF